MSERAGTSVDLRESYLRAIVTRRVKREMVLWLFGEKRFGTWRGLALGGGLAPTSCRWAMTSSHSIAVAQQSDESAAELAGVHHSPRETEATLLGPGSVPVFRAVWQDSVSSIKLGWSVHPRSFRMPNINSCPWLFSRDYLRVTTCRRPLMWPETIVECDQGRGRVR
jgi:hypothetical protein